MTEILEKTPEIAKSFIPDDAMLFTYCELAGFYDVDGSFFTKIKHTPTVSYYEKLRMIQKSFGGLSTVDGNHMKRHVTI